MCQTSMYCLRFLTSPLLVTYERYSERVSDLTDEKLIYNYQKFVLEPAC